MKITLLVCCLLGFLSGVTLAKKAPYKVRLVDGPKKNIGRVEVWVDDGRETKDWLPICDDNMHNNPRANSTGGGEAESSNGWRVDAYTVCTMLGYKYGRKYYSSSVTFKRTVTGSDKAVRDIQCEPQSQRRRLAESGMEQAPARALRGARGRGSARRMLATDQYGEWVPFAGGQRLILSTAEQQGKGRAPWDLCFITAYNGCPAPGYLAGGECSNKRFRKPAPPMTPEPPSPPPPPPSKAPFVRLLKPEPNLCANATSPDCSNYRRVELLVTDPQDASKTVWAPLCGFPAGTGTAFLNAVAKHACFMDVNWPGDLANKLFYPSAAALASSYQFAVGPVPDGGLDPASVPVWASLPLPEDGTTYVSSRLMQDNPGFQLSTSACPYGLFGMQCRVALA
ncbi:hypothetical protein HYH03_005393 [Edaphochlamys debaryana]|uniref:SRCR domain-containing protein n=1 Tax=Edaphochlamys debaryana TaxID=47281 RepID=A0A836C154_9CHLO|nr:hypothetical protein HYH03_005393 [Edaphochlamys debaryana]|eukprot:KAG2496571.1 hypothetical protein HYH03_005393 [Edaphochlamys debaryana]